MGTRIPAPRRRSAPLAAVAAAALLAGSLAACGQEAKGGSRYKADKGKGGTVGLAMPTKSSERWIADGRNMARQFKDAGYKADLQFGDDKVENQVAQIENMIAKGHRLLVVAAIDGSALTDVLRRANEADIPVISYDRLLLGTENVDYYASFDNERVGELQGGYIVDKLKLEEKEDEKFNVELFAGSPDDNNTKFFWDGAMKVLRPYIDKGQLVVRSNQTKMNQVTTLRWDGGTAQKRMDDLLSKNYGSEEVDAVLSPYDGISIGILSALKSAGYGTGDKPYPLVTGQDAELASVKSILRDQQTQTVYKDTRKLAKQAVQMGDAVLTGKKPEVNDTKTYDNGKKVVPSYLLKPVSIDKSNTQRLVDDGYYKGERVQVTAPAEQSAQAGAERTVLEMRGITKTFPGVKALSDVNLTVGAGEIHAICGENGAGKSTLVKVLSGVHPHGSYEGEILFDGEPCAFKDIRASEQRGIVIIHQELALIPYLSLAENIFLGNEHATRGVISWSETLRHADALLKRVGLPDKPQTRIADIGVGKQQLVEIAKALAKEVKLLILDEPTAALNDEDSRKLLELIRELRGQGIACIVISHKLNEIRHIADSVTILRDGRTIETLTVREHREDEPEISEDRIIRGMVGRDLDQRFPPRSVYEGEDAGHVALSVSGWSVRHPVDHQRKVVDDVSLEVRRGEIVGIAGLMGAGRTELAMSVFGRSYGQYDGGAVAVEGRQVLTRTVPEAIGHGIAYVTEDRKTYGLNLIDDINRNVSIASLSGLARRGIVDEHAERRVAERYRRSMNIKTPTVHEQVQRLSGGNQQKVVLSKWIHADPGVLILDEPTRGIDVGAKYEIYTVIDELAASGKAVVFISSELPELLGMCDRIYTMAAGRLTGEVARQDATQEVLMRHMTETLDTSTSGTSEKS